MKTQENMKSQASSSDLSRVGSNLKPRESDRLTRPTLFAADPDIKVSGNHLPVLESKKRSRNISSAASHRSGMRGAFVSKDGAMIAN